MKGLVLIPGWDDSRFRHLPNRSGVPPSEAEVRVFEGVRAELAKGGPIPPVVYVPGVAAVFTSRTWDETGRACVGLVVVVHEEARP